MKRLILLLIPFILISCASTSGVTSSKSADGFIYSVDEVTGFASYTHEDLAEGYFYNLRDNLTGERENFSLKIKNNSLFAYCDYQYNNWLFIKSFVIYAGDLRLFKELRRTSEKPAAGVTSVYVREHGWCSLSADDVAQLEQIAAADDVKICFVGSSIRSDVFTVKPKIKTAILATCKKWRELN